MEVDTPVISGTSEREITKRIAALSEYKQYMNLWRGKSTTEELTEAEDELRNAISEFGIDKDLSRDTIKVLEESTLGTPQQRFDALTWDLRLHYSPEELSDLIQVDNYALQRSIESTIATVRSAYQSDWHVWISSLIALKEARSNGTHDVFTGCFLYPSARQEITNRIARVPFRSIRSWTTASLKEITDVIEQQPVHFLIRVPKTQADFASLAHGAIVLRSMMDAVPHNSLLPYSYGVYECSGNVARANGVVVSTCVPIPGYNTSGYVLEQDIRGETLADGLSSLTQADLDTLMVVISSTLQALYEVYGFIHGNLTASNIILQNRGVKRPVYFTNSGTNGLETRMVELPFTPRLINFDRAQTSEYAWIGGESVSLPGQSPVVDIIALYSSLLKKTSKLDMSAVKDVYDSIKESLLPAKLSSRAVLWPEGGRGIRHIHRYVLGAYDESSQGRVVERRLDETIILPDRPHFDPSPLDIERDTSIARQALHHIQINRELALGDKNLLILRDWLNLRYTEDGYLLGLTLPSVKVLPEYFTESGEPLLYDVDERLILTNEEGESLVDYTATGKPIVYHPNGTRVVYEDEVHPVSSLIVIEEEEDDEE